ncbi:unnamed protein product [Adineta steineri]|uniref:MATH domain-containing protein n=1 Tax=Adineta steineri TaxID=433720 RepID=A0A813XDH8_9BILA|nr:unnamed protein product [Adineta steineri]CAF3734975.1 unnamed protein product [Adineta steineri]
MHRKQLRLDRGCRNDMQTMKITCLFCNWTDLLKTYQNHLDETHPNPICDYCNEQHTSVNDLNRHIFYNCTKVLIFCPLKSVGCDEKIPRENLRKHYLTEQHQITLIKFLLNKNLKSSIFMNNNLAFEYPSTIQNTTDQIGDLNETIQNLLIATGILNGDGQRIKNECMNDETKLDAIKENFGNMKKSVEEQNSLIDRIKTTFENFQKDNLAMQSKINNNNLSSHDGTHLWKITNINEKIEDAKSGKQIYIDSEPFYSSPAGYKMCLRLYLDGDGSTRRTHVSLFFILMRGEYDAILKFPFCFNVIFCLMDQTDKKQHIIDVFRPDVISNSFQRPQTNTNTPSGIPKFAPTTIFQQENNPYIRDNTMFIRVIVDFGHIPKPLLSYALDINPGFTTQIQQKMIQKEIEKHQQLQMSKS